MAKDETDLATYYPGRYVRRRTRRGWSYIDRDTRKRVPEQAWTEERERIREAVEKRRAEREEGRPPTVRVPIWIHPHKRKEKEKKLEEKRKKEEKESRWERDRKLAIEERKEARRREIERLHRERRKEDQKKEEPKKEEPKKEEPEKEKPKGPIIGGEGHPPKKGPKGEGEGGGSGGVGPGPGKGEEEEEEEEEEGGYEEDWPDDYEDIEYFDVDEVGYSTE